MKQEKPNQFSHKPRLSVVLAVFNEEETLIDCLSSIKDLAWEIVVVDGGSKDKTVAIAKNFNARVIETDNPPIFHINKNKAIDAALGDWILQLDADERVSPELAKEITEVLSMQGDAVGFWIPRINFFLGKFLRKGGQYPDYTLRLYKRGKGRLPARDVHEQAVVEGQVGFLKNNLLHMRDTTFAKYISGLNRYTDLMAMQMQENKFRATTFSFVSYSLFHPIFWFFKTYFRHRGYVDGFPGFIFSFFSSLRFPIAFIKYYQNSIHK